MKYANGSVYTGNWVFGSKHGNGKMKYANGSVYTGNWENGKKSGKGELKTTNNYVYNGYWKDNQQNGTGTATYANGDVYDGEWEKDKPDTTKKIEFTFKIVIDNIPYNVLYENNNKSRVTIKFLKDTEGTKTLPEGYEYGTEYTYNAYEHTLVLDNPPPQGSVVSDKEALPPTQERKVLDAIEDVLFKHDIITKTKIQDDKDMIAAADADIDIENGNTAKTLLGTP
jgi:hypothetical protein